MLTVFVGLTTLDVIQRVPRLPGPDEKLDATASELAAGGPAANAAKTYAALGGRARLVTALGEGPAATLVRADLESFGVEVVDLGAPDGAPPVASVLVTPTGERAIVGGRTGGPAGLAPRPASLAPRPAGPTESGPALDRAVIEGASLLLTDGHHPDLALPLAAEARAVGVPVVVDAGRPKPVWRTLLPHAQAAICSADFRLAGNDPAADLRALGVRQVAITAGAGPIRWWESSDQHTFSASGRLQPPEVTAVDTLGAGDVLHGAFCWHAARGLAFADALAAASALASDRCAHVGLASWLTVLRTAQRWTP